MKSATIFGTLLLALGLSDQAIAGPFGLEKGMTLKQLGSTQPLSPGKYEVTSVPRAHSAFESYVVQVGPQAGLCWVKAVGHHVRAGAYGLELKTRFTEMKTRLEQLYGTPEVFDRLLPGSVWNEPRDWMMGLIKKERVLAAIWSEKSKATLPADLRSVGLSADAISSDSGVIAVEYTFTNKKECESEISSQEDKAL